MITTVNFFFFPIQHTTNPVNNLSNLIEIFICQINNPEVHTYKTKQTNNDLTIDTLLCLYTKCISACSQFLMMNVTHLIFALLTPFNSFK